MLTETLTALKNVTTIVMDDGSDFAPTHPNTIRFAHGGKSQFWKTWKAMFTICKHSSATHFIFSPDDFLFMDVKRITELHQTHNCRPYVYNIITDDRTHSWNKIMPLKFDDDTETVGFTDCGFFCNRSALELLNFTITRIHPRFFKRKNSSSGVGYQLTTRLNKKGVTIFRPIKSLAFHGDHHSRMHPEVRKNNPIISR